ncbi:hypothetical protein MGE_04656 [Candida albicans P75010]|nr:hypothetical protein MGE_04656 [Candida albicans P75010]
MDSASCGPSTALQNLNKHAQRDNSLQHQRHQHPQHPQQQGASIHQFRQGQQVDSRLNADFKQFNNGNDFANSFMNQMNIKPSMQQHQHQQHQHQQPAWVNDFSNLSIQQQHQHQNQQQNQGTKSDWHQQFMQQQQQQPNTLQHQSNFQQMTPNYAMGSYQMRNTATTMTPMFHNQTEHQQQHKLEEEQRALEKQFDMIEKQLQNESVTTEENTNQDEAKEEFARIARKAETSMKTIDSHDSEMNEKFQNSQFLKLMSSIGNRQVELEGDKLVTSDSKEDIREKGIPETITATNPTITTAPRDTQEGQFTSQGPSNPDFAREMYDQIPRPKPANTAFPHPSSGDSEHEQQQEPNDPHQNTLPDPLAHIQDGQLSDINDPLTAARIISGGQVQMSDWVEDYDTISDTPSKLETDSNNNPNVRPFRKGQIVDHHWDEMYRDYRHDDDYF